MLDNVEYMEYTVFVKFFKELIDYTNFKWRETWPLWLEVIIKNMCGIVGVVGNTNATDILIQGLEKLEYRGYDSAGIFVAGEISSQ